MIGHYIWRLLHLIGKNWHLTARNHQTSGDIMGKLWQAAGPSLVSSQHGLALVDFNFNLSLPRLVFLLGFSNLLHVSHQTSQAHESIQ